MELSRVENILKTDVRQNKQNYLQVYLEIFGKRWQGCSCNLNTLKEAISTWYLQSSRK